MTQIPIVGVFGSGRSQHGNAELAYQVGKLVGQCDVHLLTGGGQGVMADASRGFVESAPAGRLAIGVLPSAKDWTQPKRGYPNPWVQLPIVTHLAGTNPSAMTSRNPINVLSVSQAIILHGSAGTLAEAKLCCQLERPALVLLDRRRQELETEFVQAMQELELPVIWTTAVDHRFDLAEVQDFLCRRC